jgi:predicted DNA-binding transcriptional regulator AlpA
MHPELVDIGYIAERILSCGKTKAWEILSRESAPAPIKCGPKYTRWHSAEVVEFVRAMPRAARPSVHDLRGRMFVDGKPVGEPA